MKYKNLAIGIVLATHLTGCATVAELAGADSATLNLNASQSYQQMLQEAEQKKVLDTRSATYKKVNRVFLKMKPYADQMNQTGQTFEWQVAVIKSPEINAYVAPGGKVVFYTGIIENLKLTDNEVAAIMGHEMVHALEEHAKSKIGAQTLTNLAVSIGSQYVGQSVGGYGGLLLDLGSQFGVGLPYSRNLESRADKGGLLLMAKAGYDPNAAITLWQKMNANDARGNSAIAKFMSTHPSNNDRIAALQQMMPEAIQYYRAAK
ncbi:MULTISPECIES: M48 family metallopeptidase [Acinetobacter]|uniref:M48 family metallopeptidase n=1 Tax=Acinetobacter TaxID=469 RepID=UPI002575B9B1|nr:M48 family metallopeptidase [Acinetobacter indicus]MDM1770345.1 M48 family metallopeptidase [Acinetobacter indicus]MDM1773143.1 M48 family metallopeptidase [Acinetobacter indicus]